jgi:hypothetical protein
VIPPLSSRFRVSRIRSPTSLGEPGPGVLIWGRVSEGGVELNPVFSIEARPVLPDAEGAHTVRGFAADGSLLFDLSFAGDAVPHASDPSERHFGFFVPLSPAQIDRLQRVELVSPHGVAEQASVGELTRRRRAWRIAAW